jgi:hypothetical protein
MTTQTTPTTEETTMTTIYKSKTTGEHFAAQEAEGGYLVSGPLTPEQVRDCQSDPDDVTIDGEFIATIPEDWQAL